MKYALLIGINYRGSPSELNGCINDVLKIKDELINKFGYESQNITLLTEDTVQKPTAQAIIDHITNSITVLLIALRSYDQSFHFVTEENFR